jgi:hypothetical protein
MNYKIVCVSNRVPTEWYYLNSQFFKSLEPHKPLVLGNEMGLFNGLGTKPRWLYRAITEKIIDTPYILFTDCWDVVFSANPDEIMEKYMDFNSPVVISAEKNCFPSDYKTEYDKLDSPTPYKYLNSGFIAGETSAILAILESMDLPNVKDDHTLPDGSRFHCNDQTLFQAEFLKQPVPMVLDRYQILSQTLHETNIDEFDFSGDRIRNKITNSYPCSWHFNGGSKDKISLREPILKHLGL